MPKISIGLPVYNGARYLREALDSLLTQTYSDFELIVSDNGSTDATPTIVSQYARKDSRIHSIRNETNRGAAWNYNHVFQLSSAPFFKWASHDDVCAPEYLERCLYVMDAHPDIILCFPETIIIDADSRPIQPYRNDLHLMQPNPAKRFKACLLRKALKCNAVFGLMRSSGLKKTDLIENYEGSDNILLAQLAYLGKFYELPENLFFRRDHPRSSLQANLTTADRYNWFDPHHHRMIIPRHWRWLLEYSRCLPRINVSKRIQALCLIHVLEWSLNKRKHLSTELKPFVKRIGRIKRKKPDHG